MKWIIKSCKLERFLTEVVIKCLVYRRSDNVLLNRVLETIFSYLKLRIFLFIFGCFQKTNIHDFIFEKNSFISNNSLWEIRYFLSL